jgi:serine/threonine protein kinase
MTLDDREKILLKERFASHWLKQKKWLEPQVSENYFSQYLSKKAKGNSLVFFEWLFEEHALNETQFQEAIQEYTQTLEWHCPSCHKVYLGKKEGEQPLACKNCSKTLNPPAKSSKKDPLLGSTLGACLISRKLGQGGMGSVYLAFHLRLQKWVALKILPHNPLQLENQVDRFLVEARSGSKLEHPNIVAVLDVGEEKNCYYMIQQYIEGQSLQSLLKQKKRLTLPEALPLIIELCTALAHAHQRNIIHRDIKPDNLLLDRENHLKIADFGLAKFLDTSQSLSITGTIMGTAHYMSPEQAQGNKKLDGRTDIYSVGVTLYQMLTGELPYASTENDSLMTILYRHVHDPIPLAHKIQPDLDPLFSDFICKCMAKKPEDRFQNFNEFLDQIKNYKITKIIKPQSLSLKDEKEASVLPALAPREKTLPPSSPFWKHKKFWKVALPLLFILLFFNGIQKQKKKALSLASHQENPSLQIPDHTTFPPLSSPPSLSTDLEALSAYLKTLKIGLVEHPQEEEKIKELQTKITPLVLERFENILKMLQRDYPEQSVGSSKKQLKELLSFSENLKEFFPKNFPQAQKPLNLLACLKKEIEWAEMLWSGNLESAKDRLQALKQEYPEWIPPEALIQKQIEAEALYQKEILISNFLKSIETRNIELFANTFQQWKPFQEEENPFLSFPEDYQKILTGLRQESETFLPYFQTLFLIEEKEEEMLFLGELLEEALPEELFQKNNPLEEGSKISQRKQDRTFILRLKEALQEKDKLAFTEVLKEIDQQILATKGSSKIRLQKRFQRYFQEQEEEIFTLFLPQEEEGTQEAALQEIPTFQLIQRYAPDWPQDPLKKAQLLQDPSKIALDPEKGET